MSESDILIVINKIDPSKAFQTENIPPKVLKENTDICSMTLLSDTNKCIRNGTLPNSLKYADINPHSKKRNGYIKQSIDPSAFCQCFRKSMKNFSIIKFINILTKYFLNTYVASERDKAHNTLYYSCLNH